MDPSLSIGSYIHAVHHSLLQLVITLFRSRSFISKHIIGFRHPLHESNLAQDIMHINSATFILTLLTLTLAAPLPREGNKSTIQSSLLPRDDSQAAPLVSPQDTPAIPSLPRDEVYTLPKLSLDGEPTIPRLPRTDSPVVPQSPPQDTPSTLRLPRDDTPTPLHQLREEISPLPRLPRQAEKRTLDLVTPVNPSIGIPVVSPGSDAKA